jgi:hypothetical protein
VPTSPETCSTKGVARPGWSPKPARAEEVSNRLRGPGKLAAVVLSIDTSQALRGTADLRLLVNAVVAATDRDEAD